MLQMFGFSRIGVVAADIYHLDPEPEPGNEGAERGVRVEVRLLERGSLPGSIDSSTPIHVSDPVWRADLLETVESAPGTMNRVHHHPAMQDWEPTSRVFDQGLSAAPVSWVGEQLRDLEGLLAEAGIELDEELAADARELRAWVPEITRAVGGLLERVWSGELATPPPDAEELVAARTGWL
jgi:hypothetical protein